MACFSLERKLPNPKKVWNRFTSTLLSKLLRLGRTKATQKRVSTIYMDKLYADRGMRRDNDLYPKTERRNGVATVAPLEGISEAEARTATMTEQQSDNFVEIEDLDDEDHDLEDEEKTHDIASTWKATSSTSSSQLLHGVDARAEEFINKFYAELRLQKQKSIEEFYEMLARGA